MRDLRKEFYKNYKIPKTEIDERAFKRYLDWYEYYILFFLKGIDRHEPILELGCGRGSILSILKKNGFCEVFGIDCSEEQIKIATERGISAEVADVFEFLALKEEVYKVIIAFNFIEHFSKEELMRLLASIHRALKAGGRLVIQTPNGAGLFSHQIIYGDLTHMTIFSVESLEQILELTGFCEIRFFEAGPIPRGIKGRLRTILWKIIKAVANNVRKIETGKTQDIWTENLFCCCRKSD